ncbi:hypothetical protein LTR85_009237 [Meristemomyces frigidus]|nr:hypothetical protein LTR85_009237 [Meristemomyces frigidus]
MPTKEQLEQDYGQEVSTTPTALPDKTIPIKGNYITLTEWTQDYIPRLWQNVRTDPTLLVYMPARDINTEQDLREDLEGLQDSSDVICYAVMADPEHLNPQAGGSTGGEHTNVVGLAFYGNISAKDRVIEVGAMFAPVLHRTAASTEVHYLLLKSVLDEGSPILSDGSPPYRRVAWKCNRLNIRSRMSALRVGYVYEGTYRQAQIIKGRTRDDDMFSMIDKEWPINKAALERWLGRHNWDGDGKQVKKLQQLRAELE